MKYDVRYDAYLTQLIASEKRMREVELRIREWAEEQGLSVRTLTGDELVIE